jgi:hypothetical protein
VTLCSQRLLQNLAMPCPKALLAQAFACWNWKCALLSAAVRSAVYVAALAHARLHTAFALVTVEIAYVALTGGLWAGLQQRALALRSRVVGNLLIVLAVPALSQVSDWLAHHSVGPAAPPRALVAVCGFTLVSALFHLYVMRCGLFLTGAAGRTLADDFRRIPGLVVGLIPALPAATAQKRNRPVSEPAV